VSLNAWHFIEWKWTLHNSAGTIAVQIDGLPVDDLALAGKDTLNGAATTFSSVLSGAFNHTGNYDYGYSGGVTAWRDDVYIRTGAGDLFGDVTVQTRLVTGDGVTNDGAASAGANFECVDELLADVVDYVTLDAVGELELYTVEPVAAGVLIRAVQVTALAKRTGEGSAGIAAVLRQGGATYEHPTPQGVSADYQFQAFMYERDALDAEWTAETFNALEYGDKKTA
jgi:hypothetical protein